MSASSLPSAFQTWFARRGWTPRAHQLELLAADQAGEHSLLIAPTGAGKTLAGFLPSLIDLAKPHDEPKGLHTLYISPLKALAVDVERNLMTPISEMGLPIRVETRTGDTPATKRQRQRYDPPDLLLTTPEQVALFVGMPDAPTLFAGLKRIIIDEAHALAPTKRGDLLALGMAALQRFAPTARRTGLSATVADEAALAQWIAPQAGSEARFARIVRGPQGTSPDISMLLSEERIPWAGHTGRHAMQEVYQTIQRTQMALVFVNTRFQAELAFQELWKINDANLPIALHHGSLDVSQRRRVEEAMAQGRLRAIVCTSTLDLGIDWGNVDLVIQMGAPKGSSRLIQRIGRSNHRLDEVSKAVLVPTNRFEMLECQAARDAVLAQHLDGPVPRRGAIDILAQHIMGCAVGAPFHADDLYREVTSAGPYHLLPREQFDRVLGFVTDGGYALKSYDRFARLIRDSQGRLLCRNRDAARAWRMNVGSIVAEPVLKVRQVSTNRSRRPGTPSGGSTFVGGRVVGEIEEYFVDGLSPRDTFLFAGEVWRFEGVSGTDCLVSKAQDQSPKVPSWAGGKFPLSTYLAGRVRTMIAHKSYWPKLHPQLQEWLQLQDCFSVIPREDEILVETFARGNRFHLAIYPFEGRLAHQTLGMLLTRRLERLGLDPLGFVANDYAISVWGLKDMSRVDMDELLDQDMLGDDLEEWLEESVLMKRTFRNCAVIAGLIEQNQVGKQKTGRQVTFSSDLIFDVLRRHQPDHVLLEAARYEAGEGLLDIRRLSECLARIAGQVRHQKLTRISPFAVPLMLEIGKVPVNGQALENILEEAAGDSLLREAIGPDG
ncbi:ligase-associated DNA damage response DEXH box helicase [Aquidulcibacter sp.]|uniref:ligase-associated DNA damage response DEXH box helicase n=1 Tax=Aquidulcibacter sp. TaxID=2052990 RepID=UPI0025C2C0EE|nr:ligase-associated DNA damage response DEXH box helicase [Aquidulcibacter sp.]MCA3694728.1 ligase-associated DNA damage response DEXH box helicase [Aquidulcibacter sp.]